MLQISCCRTVEFDFLGLDKGARQLESSNQADNGPRDSEWGSDNWRWTGRFDVCAESPQEQCAIFYIRAGHKTA